MATKIYLGRPPENIVNWIKAEAEREMLKTPLTFTAEQAGSTIKMVKSGSAPTVYLETSSTGEEGSWSDFIVGSTTITLENVGDKVYFRAKQDNNVFAISTNYNKFVMTGKIAASGNINTLLKADGSVLDLTGRDYCYSSMFLYCQSLTQAPILPATTLASSCYYYMFNGCTSLIQAPILPATTLASSCYSNMFNGCTALTQAPELPATTLASSCYSNMFKGCTALTQAPELPATTLADYCYQRMFYRCTALTQAPELPATTLARGCYSYMFNGCTALTTAPELPATTLANNCYQNMFSGCYNLNTIKLGYTGNFANAPSNAFYNWVSGVASTGTFYYNGSDTTTGVNAIPTGWTVI